MAKVASKAKKTTAKASPKAAKAPAAKAPAKAAKAAPKKTAARSGKKVVKGDQYSCEVCGLVVSVDETCGCVDACDIICCGQEMEAV